MRKTLLATGFILASISAAHAAQTTMSNFSYDYAEARIGISPLTYGAGFSKSIHRMPTLLALLTLNSTATGIWHWVLASMHQSITGQISPVRLKRVMPRTTLSLIAQAGSWGWK